MSDPKLRSTIKEYWQALGANPKNRALAIARIAANRDDEALTAWVTDLIERGTPPCSEKQEALASLKPQNLPIFVTPITIDHSGYTVRVDPEMGRLAIIAHRAHQFRLWAMCRDLSKVRDAKGKLIGSSGKTTRQALREQLKRLDSAPSNYHLNRLIRQGEGLFWNASRTHIYPRKPAHVAKGLVELVSQTHPEALHTNKAGVRDVYLSPMGTLEQWEAMLYAGWMAHREDPTIARDTLSMLFGRTPQTLRNWENHRLQDILTIRPNYAQALVEDDIIPTLPEHAQAYATRDGDIRLTWRIANSYRVKGIKQHPHKGQAFKVRHTVNLTLNRSADTGGTHRSQEHPATIRRSPEHPTGRLYFDDSKRLRGYLQKHGGIRYLWRGERQYTHVTHGIFEATTHGWAETTYGERASFKQEHAIFQEIAQKQREQPMSIS